MAAYLAAIIAVVSAVFLTKCNTFAVAIGATVVLSPILIVVGAFVFVISLFITKYYSLSTYFTVAAVSIFGFVLAAHLAVWATIVCLGVMVCLEQRPRLRRYRRGLEKKLNW
jgi:glycerol-3-phosphate acyltransferase PlsY